MPKEIFIPDEPDALTEKEGGYMERLTDVLKGRERSSVTPFFWQHGETKELLSEYMDKIHAGGCGGVCVEARPHPDFVKEKWWEDVGHIIKEAKKKQMEVWILDDAHFPTGYANGLAAREYPQYLKKYLDCRRFDVTGPLRYARMNLRFLKGRPYDKQDRKNDAVIGIYAARRADEDASGRHSVTDALKDPVIPQTLTDLTACCRDGILYWDIPQGCWSIFVVFETREGGEESTKDYLNPLQKEAAQILIQAVYEPHYEHFKEDFGTTVTAFFSDEPRFGNAKGTDKGIGKAEMVLPWYTGMEAVLPFKKELLLFLFADSSDDTMLAVRYAYMDTVTKLYSQNFTQVLGSWCREHGVKYTGHQIEDNGAHARLGYGAGHLFRAQKGQSFSGIDVIADQIAPGYGYHHDAFATGGNDGVFYHHALAHLGASIAQTDAEKQGIAMCEAFGAYGWKEGLKWMKWITDHLLARGINYFVPHAFNPKEYPDWDCAPHFYARGHNPQFRYFPVLITYMQRMCHLLQGGRHEASAAVLYPAEGEWAKGAQPVELVLRELDRNQTGMTVISLDDLDPVREEDRDSRQESQECRGCREEAEEPAFFVNKHRYECLIVPAMPVIPQQMAEKLLALCSLQVPVIFIDEYPSKIAAAGAEKELLKELLDRLKEEAQCVPLKEIAGRCEKHRPVRTLEYQKDLICYSYRHPDGRIIMLFNEHPAQALATEISIFGNQIPVSYDAFANQLRFVPVRYENGTMHIPLSLQPYESLVLVLKDNWDGYQVQKAWEGIVKKRASLETEEGWKLSFADAQSYTAYPDASGFTFLGYRSGKIPLSADPEFANRTGTLRYETVFEWMKGKHSRVYLNLGEVYETAEVFLNGKSAGVCICPPYRIEITKLLRDGTNELAAEVTNTLGNENQDFFSQYTPMEPFGLCGDVMIEEEDEEADG